MKMSTAFYPLTDCLTEEKTKNVKKNLQACVIANERQQDCLLGLADFTHNSHVHQVYSMSTYEVELEYNPHMPLDMIAGATIPFPEGGFIAVNFAMIMNDIFAQVTNAHKVIQAI
jgi:hypothetical protein